MPSTMADNNRVSWSYVDSSSTPVTYAVSAKAVHVLGEDAAKFGGELAPATARRIPLDLKTRKVKCTSSGLPDRYVTAYTTTATIWTTPGTQITLNVNGLDAVYFASRTHRAEKSRDTTRQTT